MASSLIGGLLNDGTDATSVRVLDVDPKQQARITERFGVSCISSTDGIGGNDAVVIVGCRRSYRQGHGKLVTNWHTNHSHHAKHTSASGPGRNCVVR